MHVETNDDDGMIAVRTSALREFFSFSKRCALILGVSPTGNSCFANRRCTQTPEHHAWLQKYDRYRNHTQASSKQSGRKKSFHRRKKQSALTSQSSHCFSEESFLDISTTVEDTAITFWLRDHRFSIPLAFQVTRIVTR